MAVIRFHGDADPDAPDAVTRPRPQHPARPAHRWQLRSSRPGVSARGPGLHRDVGGFSATAVRGHRLPRPGLRPRRLRPILADDAAAGARLSAHRRPHRAAACAAGIDTRHALRADRSLGRRQHRPHPRGRPAAAVARRRHRSGARVRGGRIAGRHPRGRCRIRCGQAGGPGALSRRQDQADLQGLVRDLAAPRFPRLEHRSAAAPDRLPAAGHAGRR